jgi:hypothetical protein
MPRRTPGASSPGKNNAGRCIRPHLKPATASNCVEPATAFLSTPQYAPPLPLDGSERLNDPNALIQRSKIFQRVTENRLPDPPEIYAFEFEGEFRRFGIPWVSTTIDNDWSIFKSSYENGLVVPAKKRPSMHARTTAQHAPRLPRRRQSLRGRRARAVPTARSRLQNR